MFRLSLRKGVENLVSLLMDMDMDLVRGWREQQAKFGSVDIGNSLSVLTIS